MVRNGKVREEGKEGCAALHAQSESENVRGGNGGGERATYTFFFLGWKYWVSNLERRLLSGVV